MNPTFLALLTTAASLSPLITFASLWQIKEWRTDRLREHLRSEGLLRQLFGILRPATLGFFGFLGFLGFLSRDLWPIATLAGYLALSAIQIILHRHPKPVWTKKAMTLVTTALLLTFLTTISYKLQAASFQLVVTPLLQPFYLFIAWILWSPTDKYLKARIMYRAQKLRMDRPELNVIGITGSVGKSTTKELLAHILEEKHPLTTPDHVNTEMGVSQWLLSTLPKNPEAEILIVEMGAYQSGEIALLCSITQPTMGVVTFIGTQHIALFGSQEELCQAKGELVAALPDNGSAFLNSDSALCNDLKELCACPITTIGTGGVSDIEAFDIEETPNGIQFRLSSTSFFVPLHGTHNVTNVLLAIAVAEKLGMDRSAIAQKLKSYRPALHTFSVREERGVTILDDTNNASQASFKAALAWAKSQPAENKILLTSGLIELGDAQDRTHTELGTLSAGIFDRVVFTHKKSARSFAHGYGQDIEIYTKYSEKVDPDSLLVCVGRMSTSIIEKLLPKISEP
ncbi:UDP-N-acetylmuramoyl-tripeptide--D-alanyl-D-alanine ligase [Patescibacteria group bacterium]|nr:UDP-N-acetylmuramoyl-tripeptide--D-alanyl-D-alanine ligase [Patescibacteria group bacterium]MBU2259455.1 UDP-N-acetylmuramoyl-tripeptide--D-alanyl-D-alanine ligase [Patescibacteria group bacterium]